MRIALAVEQLRRRVPGGIGTYTTGLLQGLAAMGSEAPWMRLHASRPRTRPDSLLGFGHAVSISALPAPLLTRAWDRGILTIKQDVDLMHSTSLAVPPAGSVPTTVMIHDVAWRIEPSSFPARGRRWHEAAFTRALGNCDLFIVPAATIADAVLAEGTAKRVEVVEEGCDHLPPADFGAAATVLAGLGVTGPFLLTASTLEPRKNLVRLASAYARARPRLPDLWPLVVVGPNGWVGGAPPPVDGVVMAGRVDAAVLSALLASARCVAYVPVYEGFGLPAVEAMAAGAPVVATPMPSTGGAALEVDPGDIDAIADALVVAATDSDDRDALIAAGRHRAAALTWEAAARSHVQIWESIA